MAATITPRFDYGMYAPSARMTKTTREKKKIRTAPKSARRRGFLTTQFSGASSSNSTYKFFDTEDEQSYYEAEFERLTYEVAALQCEVKPLRQNYVRLQNEILMHHRAITSSDESITESDTLNNAVTTGDFSSAIILFQNESNSLSRQLSQVKQLFSQNSLRILRQEVEDGENHCAVLAQSVAETEREIQKNVTQYETYKLSSMYEDVQLQKEKIYNLTTQLDEAMELHSKLKSENYLLSDTSQQASAYYDEATQITKLNRKLSAARRKHFEQCELFITIRNKQLKEIEAVGGAIHMKQMSTTSLTALSQFQSSDCNTNP
ncbi:hypothetical protein M9Y10_012209 [Tritrichomonas musculus]|uniref:Uncharacterized protein n=1 Tax=Tritrichomonas musculus TaxID=1915356 RepID=A0ABR2IBW4_9EUKA